MNILITGTSRGIGKYLADYYLRKGCRVYGISRGDSTIDHINYFHMIGDVCNEVDLLSLSKFIKEQYDSLDVLINNAGISSMNHTLTTPLETARKIMDINFIGTFLVSKYAVRLMKGQGRIVNMSSVAYPMKLEGEAIYAASKAAVVSLTQIMAKELAERNITVNAVGPNPIPTDLIKGVSNEKMDSLIDSQPLKWYGTYEDISNVIDFFIKPESNFITGQVIYLGGVS